ncbi:nucleotidyltransferase domain-containing protein [Actinomadura kijaniata]|uniref:nucleotidyltransferase domain-containing protein n=1 Tax=Actinomadura kijaniata TaxID=46161 RepID=UPI00082AD2EE|nr:nucleotidyltransferase domain-containing protein [Actinomadura kijaniata]
MGLFRPIANWLKKMPADRHPVRRVPQGFTDREFRKFARNIRQLQRQAGLPKGDLILHGSRIKGTARTNSDIDIALRVNKKDFFNLAERALARAPLGTRLRKSMLRRFNENGQIASFDLGSDFQKLRRELLDSNSPVKVQFSVLLKGGKLDNGPSLPIQ